MSENTQKERVAKQILAEEKPINVKDLVWGYLRYWPWFLICGIVSMSAAIMYLKLNKPVYRAVASVIIEDEKGKPNSSGFAGFSDFGIMEGLSTSSIENELGLMRSRRLMTNAVRALGLNVVYYTKGEVLGISSNMFPSKELYKQTPYKLRLVRMDDAKLNQAVRAEQNVLEVTLLSDEKMMIEQIDGDYKATHQVGDVVKLNFAEFIVEKNSDAPAPAAEAEEEGISGFKVKLLPVQAVSNALRAQLSVALVSDNSTLIQLAVNNQVPEKARDILDQLVFEYNQEAIEDKNLIARNTAFFIDERLKIINSELDSVESGKEQFKTANKLTDIQTESSIIIQNVSDYNNRQQEIATELEVVNAMMDHVSADDLGLLPANMGVGGTSMSQFVDEYNRLVLERNRLLKGATETNPLVVNLSNQLREIKENIRQSLVSTRSNLRITRDNLRRQAGILGSQISEKPSQEREFRGIERQQNIKESLYLFLLQKREENSLSLAAKGAQGQNCRRGLYLGGPGFAEYQNRPGPGAFGRLLAAVSGHYREAGHERYDQYPGGYQRPHRGYCHLGRGAPYLHRGAYLGLRGRTVDTVGVLQHIDRQPQLHHVKGGIRGKKQVYLRNLFRPGRRKDLFGHQYSYDLGRNGQEGGSGRGRFAESAIAQAWGGWNCRRRLEYLFKTRPKKHF